MNLIPFKQENKKVLLQKITPEIRFITSFIFSIPCVFIYDVFYIILIFITIIFIGIVGGGLTKNVIIRWAKILPIIFIFIIFIPFFNGTIEYFSFCLLNLKIIIYLDRLEFAIKLFFTINTMFFSFMIFLSSLTFTEFANLRIIPSLFRSTLVIMLSYIPLFFQQTKRISEAQLLRGKQEIKGIYQKLKNFGFMLGNTIIKSLEQSSKTYESLKLRGFGGVIPTYKKNLKIIDYIFISLCVLFIATILYFNMILGISLKEIIFSFIL